MGYRAHVCTKYEIQLQEISSADKFKEFTSWLETSSNFDDVVWGYEGEFCEYSEWVEFDRAGLTNILESNEIPEKFNAMVKEITWVTPIMTLSVLKFINKKLKRKK